MRRTLNEIELVSTRVKLAGLERLYKTHEREHGGDEELRDMSMRSLKTLINQLKEEIIWSEIQQPAAQ